MIEHKNQDGKILLSISLLVSNRLDTIRKCMESIRPILERIPSELIAVDTVESGKSDGSIDVVREYTEKIVPFTWCGDFAAARNAGLEMAQGEWFMYIDDDEWLEDPSPIIDFFETGIYKHYNYAVYTVRNYTDPEGSRWADTLQGRLFPIHKDTRFVGKIHEMVLLEEPVYKLPCYAHHYGYVFRTQADKEKHIQRNLELLLGEYREDKGNCRIAAHLIQEYEGSGRFEESLHVIQESCAVSLQGAASKFWHFLKLHEVLDYICLKDFARAYESGAAYLQGKHLLMGAQVGVHCLMMEVCEITGRLDESMHHLESYLELAEEITKRQDLVMLTVLDISQFWDETNRKKAYARGVNVAYRLGNLERAVYYVRKIDWREKELLVLEGTVDNTFHLFEKLFFEPWMTEVMEAILERGFARGGIDDVLATMEPHSLERRRILQILASCHNHGVQVSGYRAEYAVLAGDTALMCQALQELADNPEGNLLMLSVNTLQYLYEAEINGREYVEKVPFYRWHFCVGQWSQGKTLQEKRKECFLWRGMMPAEPLYILDMEAALLEEEALACVAEGRGFHEMHQSLLKMAGKFHEVYTQIYHPDTFVKEGKFTILPPEAQFAEKYLYGAGCLEQGDEKGFVISVKEAGMCCQALGETCKVLLEKYRDEQNQKNKENDDAKAELAILIQMLKGKAERLWESGREEEAIVIIKQILQVQPDAVLAEKYHL